MFDIWCPTVLPVTRICLLPPKKTITQNMYFCTQNSFLSIHAIMKLLHIKKKILKNPLGLPTPGISDFTLQI